MPFTPRLTAPSASDPLWIKTTSGGYNQCIYGSDGPPSVLPNCTGYVHGRVMEIRGVTTDDGGLSFGDAWTYWNSSSNIWIQTQTPSEGAILVYETVGGPSPGHVAVVEQVIDNDTCVISESHYGGARFVTWTVYRQYGWRNSGGWNVTPYGFLKNPYVQPTPPPGGPLPIALLLYIMKKRKENKNGRIRRNTGILRL